MISVVKYRDLLEKIGLSTFDGVMKARGDLVADHRGRREILKITLPGAERVVLYLKRVFRPKRKDGLQSLLKRGRVWSCSREEWENLAALQAAGFNTPQLVAFGERCNSFWEICSFLLTQEVDASETLEQFVQRCRQPAERRRMFRALAHEIRKLHQAGFSVPDLFSRHVFIEHSNTGPRFWFIDLARMSRGKTLSVRQRAFGLAALNLTVLLRFASVRERLRFLCDYANAHERRLLLAKTLHRMRHLSSRRKFRDFSAPGQADGR